MRRPVYPVGKLPMAHLRDLLARYGGRHPQLISGVGIGEDATIIDLGDRYLAAKSDPVTFATDQIGWYAVNINANDLACCGARPRWFLCTVLLPDGATDRALVESIFEQVATACRQLGVVLAGGHTEVTYDLKRPIVVGQMLGEVAKDKLVVSSRARAGDIILMTKAAAIEGTALIAREKRKDLLRAGFSTAALDEVANLLYQPGISVVRDAMLAIDAAPIHAMHDPTEGGIVTGLHELAQAAHLGLIVDVDAIPILPACRDICRHFNLHPLGLLASGSLLMTVEPRFAHNVTAALAAAGIACTAIGHMLPLEDGCKMRIDGAPRGLPLHERDEVTKIL